MRYSQITDVSNTGASVYSCIFDNIHKVICMSPTEAFSYYYTHMDSAFQCGSVRAVRAKKPENSLLCTCDTEELTDGEWLRVLRLRAGLTIRQAAEQIGISRHTLMNYESGKAKVKPEVREKLVRLYSGY